MNYVLEIEGMVCMNCVNHVTKALKKIKGVKKVDVSLEDGTATVLSKIPIDEDQMISAIEEVGYSVKKIDS